jgi:hypothetical protein
MTWAFERLSIRHQNITHTLQPAASISNLGRSTFLIFYYAVPEGLIKPEEVPKYAGLIYVSDSCQQNLWQYKVPLETKMKIRNNYSE